MVKQLLPHHWSIVRNMQVAASATLDSSIIACSYEKAVAKLNSLQSNVEKRKKAAADRNVKFGEYNLVETADCLKRVGIGLSQLDALNIIHVTGTKGKGSTCAFVESMLRQYQKKTGFYSSPHLVHVTERIRLDGKPISRQSFASYFWTVYNRLLETDPANMPPYFTFLTTMMFYVFLQEKVDVAIIEVGIGGQGDSTNVIRNPVVCGVTTLDYDHQSILGNTLEEIAWQKAGIFKAGSVAVTVEQEPQCLEVFKARAVERDCQLFVASSAKNYQNGHIFHSIVARQYQSNIALAVHLTHLWLSRIAGRTAPDVTAPAVCEIPVLIPPVLSTEMLCGLKSAHWPGRYQVLKLPNHLSVYLDGAHTPKSMQCCSVWFCDASAEETPTGTDGLSSCKILLFNCTADRNPTVLLEHLRNCNFSYAVFCPNLLDAHVNPTSDSANLRIPEDQQVERSHAVAEAWKAMRNTAGDTVPSCISEVRPSVTAAWSFIRSIVESESRRPVQVLVTGSLHLVGAVLELLNVDVD